MKLITKFILVSLLYIITKTNFLFINFITFNFYIIFCNHNTIPIIFLLNILFILILILITSIILLVIFIFINKIKCSLSIIFNSVQLFIYINTIIIIIIIVLQININMKLIIIIFSKKYLFYIFINLLHILNTLLDNLLFWLKLSINFFTIP